MTSSIENKRGFSSLSFVADLQSVIVCWQLCSESQYHAGVVVVVGSSPPLLWGRLSAEQQRQVFVLSNLRTPRRSSGLQSARRQMLLMSAAAERLQLTDVTDVTAGTLTDNNSDLHSLTVHSEPPQVYITSQDLRATNVYV